MLNININENNRIPNETKNAVDSVVELFDERNFQKAEKKLAYLVLNLINQVINCVLEPQDADDIFTFLYVYITDNFKQVPISSKLADIFIEGMTLHHLNDKTDYGPNLDKMKQIAEDIAHSL
jgi:hypothetical protein